MGFINKLVTAVKDSVPSTGDYPHPGFVPSQPIVWPAPRQVSNKLQQTRGSATPQSAFALPSTQPSTAIVAPRTTPPPVNTVRVITSPEVNGQKTVRVQFNHPTGNPYFSGAAVYLRKGGSTQPVQVAAGAASPLSFTVPVNDAPHVVHVTSVGNWGETDVLTSPSHPVRLR